MKSIVKQKTDGKLALALLAPSIILLLLLVAYPMFYNIRLSFFYSPLNPNLDDVFVGLDNFIAVLTDPLFYESLFITLAYTAIVVVGSTVVGLGIAMFLNREFRFRKIVRSLIILSYVAPSISLIFAWRYMFNNLNGIINHYLVDVFGILDTAPLWFDNPTSSFIVVSLFAIWRYFPYAYISLLAILQTIDNTLYEAAEVDGASLWQKFKIVTLPAIMPVLITIVMLRTIWMFYMFAEVYLLTNRVNVLGIYLFRTAFAFNDLGMASAISVILFLIIFSIIFIGRKWVRS